MTVDLVARAGLVTVVAVVGSSWDVFFAVAGAGGVDAAFLGEAAFAAGAFSAGALFAAPFVAGAFTPVALAAGVFCAGVFCAGAFGLAALPDPTFAESSADAFFGSATTVCSSRGDVF
jgi:hypothetical protein